MTDKQKRFADEYLIDCNAEQAAIRAGYSEHYARGNAHKLVANSCIKTYIDEQLQKLSNDKIATATEVMEFMSAVMRGSVKEIDKAVVEGEVVTLENEPRIREKLRAAELLGKRFGLDKAEEDTDKQEKTNEILVKIKQVADNDRD